MSSDRTSSLQIVSLIPSATEIVHSLGCTAQLVGRSHECDYPPQVVRLPVCTEPKLRTDVPSIEIDRQVKSILENALAVYRVFVDRLEALKPDVILTQAQCEVCAVSLKDVEAAVCQLVSCQPKIVSLMPMVLSDVWQDIKNVAEALLIPEKGDQVVRDLQARCQAIADKTSALPEKPTVALIEWIEPLMAGGNWMPELVEMAGGRNLFGQTGIHSPWISLDDLVKSDPDRIVVSPCGFELPRVIAEMKVLNENPAWLGLRAVKEGHVYLTDGNQFFNRPGPRLVESLEILAEILHPKTFSFGHQGKAWQPAAVGADLKV